MKLLIGTHNRGKLKEYQEILHDLPFELFTLDDVGIRNDVEETGATLEENAELKARAYAAASGLLALADDSGLEVDALGGEPGVLSKRYAGEDKTDAERNAYLLARLRDVSPRERSARFRCVIAVARPGGPVWTAEGRCEGEIALDERGTNGFGYDPVFIVSERGARMAELASEDKNRISHRGRAAAKARARLAALVGRVEEGR